MCLKFVSYVLWIQTSLWWSNLVDSHNVQLNMKNLLQNLSSTLFGTTKNLGKIQEVLHNFNTLNLYYIHRLILQI